MFKGRESLQNITMSKGGAYSLATRGAADVINASTPLIEQALSEMDLRGRTDFSVADMGCADGGTSLQMIETIIEKLGRRLPRFQSRFTTPINPEMITTV